MELGIKAEEIMNEEFPILDSTLTLEACMRKLNNNEEACIIVDNGFVHSIISYDKLLKTFLSRKRKDIKLEEISGEDFVIVSPETDVFEIIRIMKRGTNFIVVRDKNIFGLITKKEIAEINQLLFDRLMENKTITA